MRLARLARLAEREVGIAAAPPVERRLRRVDLEAREAAPGALGDEAPRLRAVAVRVARRL